MDLKFRDTLPPDVLAELDQLSTKLRQYLYTDHDADGHHTSISPQHLTLQGALAGELVNLPYDATRYLSGGSGTWTVSSTSAIALRYTRIGQVVVVSFVVDQSVISVDTPTDGLVIRLPELHGIPTRGPLSGVQWPCGVGAIKYHNHTQAIISNCWADISVEDYAGIVPSTTIEIYGMTVAFASLPVTISFVGTVMFLCEKNNVATPYYGS